MILIMEPQLTTDEKETIGKGIRQKYAQVAKSPEGLFKYPTGRGALNTLHYDPRIIATLPE
jgi:arsenite methyltransferase